MRVLRIFHGGGVPEFQRRDEELAKLGIEVLLLVPRKYRELPEITIAEFRHDEIVVHPISIFGPLRNPFFFYSPFKISKSISSFSPDLIDIHEEPYSLAMGSILLGIKISRMRPRMIFRTSQNLAKSYPPPFSWIQRWAFRSASDAYAPSNQAVSALGDKGFQSPKHVIGNGTSTWLPGDFREGGTFRTILFVGRLTERKGVLDLVKATLEADLPANTTLEIVGSGELENEISVFRDRLKTAGVTLVMRGSLEQSEVRRAMLKADIICVPSKRLEGWEGQFSRALVEGMSSYCAPLVSDSGALPEIAGPEAMVFESGNIASLSLALAGLVRRTNLDEIRLSSAEFATQYYSWRATSERLVDIYRGKI